MDDASTERDEELSSREISDAISGLGWRYVLGLLRTCVRVDSAAQAAEIAVRAVAAAGVDAEDHLSVDLRRDRAILTLQSVGTASVTVRDVAAARRISSVVNDLGLQTDAEVDRDASRSVQVVEIAIDALDIASIRPFWAATLGYGDEAGRTGPEDPIIDPFGQGPAVWFQQMDSPRPQRNRIHLDISVPHDEAQHRIQVALTAGGAMLSDARAPAFWVLADPEGNEACVTTWQGRDVP